MTPTEQIKANRDAAQTAYDQYAGAALIVSLLGLANPAYSRAVDKELELLAAWQEAVQVETAYFQQRDREWKAGQVRYGVTYLATVA